MYRRYDGNSGRARWVPEPGENTPRPAPPPVQPPVQPPRPAPPLRPPPAPGGGLAAQLGKLLPNRLPELETEDLLLLLILYLMYRDSGDSDLLIMMGAMFLL